MDYKEACSAIAATCREQVDADPVHRDFWLSQANEWSVRAREERADIATTHEVHEGRLVPKPAKDGNKP
jgi:hypothetical protein